MSESTSCAFCGEELSELRVKQRGKFCDAKCWGLSQRRPEHRGLSSDELRRIRWRRWDRKRRAMERDASSESYTRNEIGERDEWRCGICSRKVNRALAYPHRRSAVVDHVVPLSRGGNDTRRNVQIAHWDCNASKGSGVAGDGEQLRLIG